MVDRIPPPHTPIPPNAYQTSPSIQHQKNDRLEEFELLKIKIEQFVIMASKDPQVYENIFIQIDTLRALMHSGILNADQQNILLTDLSNLDFELNSGSLKIKDIYKKIFLLNSDLETKYIKIKVFNIIQSLKNSLISSPLDDLPAMNSDDFNFFEKKIIEFIRKGQDIEKFDFHVKQLFDKLEKIHKTFLHHPRLNHANTINQIMHIASEID